MPDRATLSHARKSESGTFNTVQTPTSMCTQTHAEHVVGDFKSRANCVSCKNYAVVDLPQPATGTTLKPIHPPIL